VPFRLLRKSKKYSLGESENLILEGDNLEALKALMPFYYGKVKCIFIDPPYNTGNDFIYPDNYSESLSTYLAYAGMIDADGRRFSTNTSAEGRFHTKWLNMMYPRMRLARDLLSDDGCICVMISDVEFSNLRSLMNEIFGEENYINTINVLTKVAAGASGGGEDKRLKKNIEYLLIYAKNANEFTTLTHMYSERPLMDVIHEMKANNESWKYTSILLDAGERKLFATTKDGEGNQIQIFKRINVKRTNINTVCKDEGLSEEDAYKKYFNKIFSDTNAQTSIRTRVIEASGSLDNNELLEVEYIPRSGKSKGEKVIHSYISNTVRRVIWLYDVAEIHNNKVVKKEKLGTLWDDIDFNNVGKEGDVPFPNGKKPIQLIQRCLDIVNDKNSIVLDFFAGSCSTAHAVLSQNVKDDGSRRFVVVQLPELVNEKDSSLENLIEFCKSEKIPLNIAEIGKERIRRAIKQLEIENPIFSKKRNGFRAFDLNKSNFKIWDSSIASTEELQNQLEFQVENLIENSNEDDVLFEILLKNSFDLSEKIEVKNISGNKYYSVRAGALLIFLGKSISIEAIEQIIKLEPIQFICLDSAFYGNDQLKANAAQNFKNSKITFITL
jgi:adenine-specific DNA-methyltransferase